MGLPRGEDRRKGPVSTPFYLKGSQGGIPIRGSLVDIEPPLPPPYPPSKHKKGSILILVRVNCKPPT